MLVMVDSNEEATNPKVVELLRKYFPKLQVTHLEFGDINVVLDNGSLLSIERKNVSDFLGSIGDGRVFNQVERMAAGAKFYAIIMIGQIEFDKDDMVVVDGRATGWRGVAVRSAIYALQWSGCPIEWCANYEGLPFILNEMIKFCEQPEVHLQKIGHKRVVTFPPVDDRIQLLTMFPSVGFKRADSLLRFARDPNKKYGDEPDGVYGTVTEALVWGSAMSLIKRTSRPVDWGDATIQNFRIALGLDSQEYIDIRKDDGK